MLDLNKYLNVSVIVIVVLMLLVSPAFAGDERKSVGKKHAEIVRTINIDNFDAAYLTSFINENSNPKKIYEYQLSVKYSKEIKKYFNKKYGINSIKQMKAVALKEEFELYRIANERLVDSTNSNYTHCGASLEERKKLKVKLRENRKKTKKSSVKSKVKIYEENVKTCKNSIDVNSLLKMYMKYKRKDNSYVKKFNNLFLDVLRNDQVSINYSYQYGNLYGKFVLNYFDFFDLNGFNDAGRFSTEDVVFLTDVVLNKYYYFHDMSGSAGSFLYNDGVLSWYSAQQSTKVLINLLNWAKQKGLTLEVDKISEILCGYNYKSYDVLSQIRGEVELNCD